MAKKQEKKANPPDSKLQKEQVRKAEGKIKIATDRLMHKYPFYAAVIGQMPVIARPDVPTMGVTFGHDCILLIYCPEFVANIELKYLTGILQHEVHHVIFHHLLMKSKEYPNKRALICAQEVTVNEFIKEPLPDWVYKLADYPELAPMQSTIERYKILDKKWPKSTIQFKVPGGWAKGGGQGKSGKSDTHDADDPNPGSGGGEGDGSDPGAGSLDNHDIWEMDFYGDELDKEAKEKGKTKEEIIEDIIQEAVEKVGVGNIADAIKDACQQHGTAPGGMLEQVARGGKADPWTLLRHYVGQATAIRPIFTRPPRRFPDMVGVIPAYSRQVDYPRILCAIDTSGSITSEMLSQMDANLRVMAKDHEITIAECDTMIYRTYKFKSGLKEVQGRGGTDLRPPLREEFLKKHKPDVVIYFTDGYGDVPSKAPKVPVIWAILPYGCHPVTWGKAVFLKGGYR